MLEHLILGYNSTIARMGASLPILTAPPRCAHSDAVVTCIYNALDLLLRTGRFRATLRT